MRILHLVDGWTRRGGAGWFAQWLVAAQARRGFDVVVAAGRILDAAPPGIACERVSLLARRTAGGDARRLDDVASRWRPARIWVHAVVNPTALRWAAARGAVMTVQDHRVFCPGRGRWTGAGERCTHPALSAACARCLGAGSYASHVVALTRARLEAVRAMARVHVLSHYMARELEAVGVATARIAVVPAPAVVDAAVLREPRRPDAVLFAGRLVESKGCLDALAAWRRSGVGLPFVVAGEGPLAATLARGGARVLGWLDRAALARQMRHSAVLVMPSRWQEPYGMVGVEALALGCPVAAWQSGGVEEWHPGDGLVAWGDVDGLAAAIRALVAAPGPWTPRIDVAEGRIAERLQGVLASAR